MSQHKPSQRCSATSIDGNGNGAPATDSGAGELVNTGTAKVREEMAVCDDNERNDECDAGVPTGFRRRRHRCQ